MLVTFCGPLGLDVHLVLGRAPQVPRPPRAHRRELLAPEDELVTSRLCRSCDDGRRREREAAHDREEREEGEAEEDERAQVALRAAPAARVERDELEGVCGR